MTRWVIQIGIELISIRQIKILSWCKMRGLHGESVATVFMYVRCVYGPQIKNVIMVLCEPRVNSRTLQGFCSHPCQCEFALFNHQFTVNSQRQEPPQLQCWFPRMPFTELESGVLGLEEQIYVFFLRVLCFWRKSWTPTWNFEEEKNIPKISTGSNPKIGLMCFEHCTRKKKENKRTSYSSPFGWKACVPYTVNNTGWKCWPGQFDTYLILK